MNDVTDRFIRCYEFLKNEHKFSTAKEFITIIEANQSLMSDLYNDRTNVGINAVKNIAIKFNVSVEWILTGEGKMFSERLQNVKQDYNQELSEAFIKETTQHDESSLRDNIRFYCRKNKITVKELAKQIGMTESNLYNRFKKNSMGIEHLNKIASVLKVNIGDLVSGNTVTKSNVVTQVSTAANANQKINFTSTDKRSYPDDEFTRELESLKAQIDVQLDKISLLQENIEQLKKIISLLEKGD